MLKNLLHRNQPDVDEQDQQLEQAPKKRGLAGLFGQKKAKGGPEGTPLDPPVGGTAASRFLTYGIMGAAYGSVCLALFMACTAMGTASEAQQSAQASHPEAVSELNITDTSAEAKAVGYVQAWLEATNTEHTTLDTYVNVPVNSQTPTEVRGLRAAGFTKSGDLVTVRVTGDVKTTMDSAVKGEEPKSMWVQRWWQVVLRTDTSSGTLSVVGLPAPIAAPGAVAADTTFEYPKQVGDPAARAAVQEFLTAYLAGSGEVSRYTAPGSTITAVTPAPYSKVLVQSLNATDEMSAKTAVKDGTEVQVLVTAQLDQGASSQTSTYFLTMASRAGRWEVKSIDTTPKIS